MYNIQTYIRWFSYIVVSIFGAYIGVKFQLLPGFELKDYINYFLLCSLLKEILDWKYSINEKEFNNE